MCFNNIYTSIHLFFIAGGEMMNWFNIVYTVWLWIMTMVYIITYFCNDKFESLLFAIMFLLLIVIQNQNRKSGE